MSSNRFLMLTSLVCLGCAGLSIQARPVHAQVREVGQLVFDGIPEVPDRIIQKMNQYQNVREATFADWAPSGGMLVATRFGETYQIHHVAEPMAARKQLTFFSEPVSDASFGTDSRWFLFNRDAGGNEASQIFRFDLRAGEATLLTDGELQNGGPVWSNDHTRVAWRSTARNATDHDVWVMDPTKPEERKIAAEVEGYWFPMDWSPDDTKLLIAKYVSITESYFWTVDLTTGKRAPFGNQGKVKGETISYSSAVFDASGKGAFYTSDEKSEFLTLRWAQLGSKKYEEITGDIPWNVGSLRMSPSRDRLAFTVNDNGRDKLYVMDTTTKKYEEIPLPLGIVGGLGFSRDGKDLAFTLETTAGPSDVYSVNLASKEITRWTESEVGGLDTSSFVQSALIEYPTFDKDATGKPRMIPAVIYKPEGKGPCPVIVRIHGGPESQTRAFFSYTSP
jgi:Tol biopolymer transport system component